MLLHLRVGHRDGGLRPETPPPRRVGRVPRRKSGAQGGVHQRARRREHIRAIARGKGHCRGNERGVTLAPRRDVHAGHMPLGRGLREPLRVPRAAAHGIGKADFLHRQRRQQPQLLRRGARDAQQRHRVIRTEKRLDRPGLAQLRAARGRRQVELEARHRLPRRQVELQPARRYLRRIVREIRAVHDLADAGVVLRRHQLLQLRVGEALERVAGRGALIPQIAAVKRQAQRPALAPQQAAQQAVAEGQGLIPRGDRRGQG